MKPLNLVLSLVFLMFAFNVSAKKVLLSSGFPQTVHEAVVVEILQVSSYTYLKVKENGEEIWLAVKKMQATVGQKYYYSDGMLMTDFESKELNKKFSKILFLEKVYASKDELTKSNAGGMHHSGGMGSHPVMGGKGSSENQTGANTKHDRDSKIKVEPLKDGITISELFTNVKKYNGQKVKIRAQVTKYTAKILYKNWAHIQDGTQGNGKFDLTVTTTSEVKTGDIVVFEGKVVTDKDFGHGYKFDVMLEDAVLVK